MACCAFAAFLISQIILAVDWARERFGLAPARAALRAPPERGRLAVQRLGLAAAAGGLAFVVLVGLTVPLGAAARPWAAARWICTAHGLEKLGR